MKNKKRRAAAAARVNLAEILLAVLPLLVLTPNFFIIPDLTYPGLATQEVVFALAVLVCAAIGLAKALQVAAPIKLERQSLYLLATLLAFCLWQVVSLAWAPDWSEGARVAGFWFGLLIFFVTAWWAVQERSAWWI